MSDKRSYDARIDGVQLSDTKLSVDLRDGRSISVPFSLFSKLRDATSEQRARWTIDSDGESIHWPELALWIGAENLLRFETPTVRFLNSVPFDEEFLRCLDQVTGGLQATAGGLRFCGTDYNKGISDAQISAAEKAVGATFPDDLRLFLRNLHDPAGVFFPWTQVTTKLYANKMDRLVDGFLFDVEKNGLWLDSWGARPSAKSERAEFVRAEIARWPKLVPIIGHRFMAIEPLATGNPVFSIHQSDVIYYGPDIGRFLCNEFLRIGLGSSVDGWMWASASPRSAFDPWNSFALR
jgi:hypothetical protein